MAWDTPCRIYRCISATARKRRTKPIIWNNKSATQNHHRPRRHHLDPSKNKPSNKPKSNTCNNNGIFSLHSSKVSHNSPIQTSSNLHRTPITELERIRHPLPWDSIPTGLLPRNIFSIIHRIIHTPGAFLESKPPFRDIPGHLLPQIMPTHKNHCNNHNKNKNRKTRTSKMENEQARKAPKELSIPSRIIHKLPNSRNNGIYSSFELYKPRKNTSAI
mmetsp:Transcript_15464/g.38973  ORF Transcript_15464/g.38973 Transcript_15464/m.38973 type:complete len:217 (+) Transcript_15464:1135-1785(+)